MGNSSIPKQQIVEHVDLYAYQGTWYEIARKPNFFEEEKAFNITAQYELLENGTMSVLNSEEFFSHGVLIKKTKRGIARVTNTETNSQLSVKFSGVPFEGEYWIVRLVGESPNYTDVVVSHRGGRYLWILSRNKTSNNVEMLVNSLLKEGYDLSTLIFTEQK